MNARITLLSLLCTGGLLATTGLTQFVAAQAGNPASAAVATVKVTGTALLSGRVANPTADTIAIIFRANQFDPAERTTFARLDEKGDFQVSVAVKGPVRADLVYGDATADLYLDANTDLDVRFKGDDMPGTLKFKVNRASAGGSGRQRGAELSEEQLHQQQMANANTYLAEFDREFVSNEGYQVLPENILLYETPFLSFIDYRVKHELEFLEDHAEKGALSSDFYNYAKAEITYSNANDRLTYQDLREQVVASEPRLTMSATYYDFLRKPELLNDPTASQNEQYQEFLLNYINHSVQQYGHKRTDADYLVVCYTQAAKRLSGEARLLTLGRILQQSFRFGHVQQSRSMLQDFYSFDTQQEYFPTLEASFDQHKELAVGTLAPDFQLTSATGDTVKLSDFQGKLVYLNFWKSNNPLCQRDLPYAQDLSKRFEGKNVVFINISLDEQATPWQQLVQTRKLTGIQLRAEGGLQSAVAQAYHVTTAPSYVLLGEDGTILTTKPKSLSSRPVVEEINESFGRAGIYAASLSLLSSTASIPK